MAVEELQTPNTDELKDHTQVQVEVMDVNVLVEQMKPYMSKPFVDNIRGNVYPKVEWWNMLGSIVGVKPVLENSQRIDQGSARHSKDGEITYEATIQLRSLDGLNTLHGRATSTCSSAEKMWSNTEEYAIGSMAQTRATGKAYRLGYSHVALASGIQATPAEEMWGIADQLDNIKTPKENIGAFPSTSMRVSESVVEGSDGSFVLPVGQFKGKTLDEVYNFVETTGRNAGQRRGEGWLRWMSSNTPTKTNQLPAVVKKFLDEKSELVQEAKQASVVVTDVPNVKNKMPADVRSMLSQVEVNPGAWREVAGNMIGTDKSLYDYTDEDFDNLSTALSRKLQGELDV